MKTIRLILVAAIAVFSLSAVPCRAEQDALEPVEFQQIQLGGFWKQQAKRLTEKWLPHCIRQMESGGAGQELLNLVHTAKVIRGEPHGKYTGAPWSDAYVYNTVEAICLALAVEPDGDAELAQAQAALRAKVRSGSRSSSRPSCPTATSIRSTRSTAIRTSATSDGTSST